MQIVKSKHFLMFSRVSLLINSERGSITKFMDNNRILALYWSREACQKDILTGVYLGYLNFEDGGLLPKAT